MNSERRLINNKWIFFFGSIAICYSAARPYLDRVPAETRSLRLSPARKGRPAAEDPSDRLPSLAPVYSYRIIETLLNLCSPKVNASQNSYLLWFTPAFSHFPLRRAYSRRRQPFSSRNEMKKEIRNSKQDSAKKFSLFWCVSSPRSVPFVSVRSHKYSFLLFLSFLFLHWRFEWVLN